MRVTVSGRSSFSPERKMATVCVPHTSMKRTGVRDFSRMADTTPSASSGSRYSSTYFIVDNFPPSQLKLEIRNPKHEIRNNF
jgi:hypothetical protein